MNLANYSGYSANNTAPDHELATEYLRSSTTSEVLPRPALLMMVPDFPSLR